MKKSNQTSAPTFNQPAEILCIVNKTSNWQKLKLWKILLQDSLAD